MSEIQAICDLTGRRRADIFREAIASYLGKSPPAAIANVLESHEHRIAKLEQKLSILGS